MGMDFNVALVVGIEFDFEAFTHQEIMERTVPCSCKETTDSAYCPTCGKHLRKSWAVREWSYEAMPPALAEILREADEDIVEAFYEDAWSSYPEHAKLMKFGENEQPYIGYLINTYHKHKPDTETIPVISLLDMTNKVRDSLWALGFEVEPQLHAISYWA